MKYLILILTMFLSVISFTQKTESVLYKKSNKTIYQVKKYSVARINKDNKYKLENFKHSQTNKFFIYPHKEIPEPIGRFEDWKKEILAKYYDNLPRNMKDIFDRKTGQLYYKLNNVTSIPNNYGDFLKFTGMTYDQPDNNCKYDGVNCLKYDDLRYH